MLSLKLTNASVLYSIATCPSMACLADRADTQQTFTEIQANRTLQTCKVKITSAPGNGRRLSQPVNRCLTCPLQATTQAPTPRLQTTSHGL